MSDNISDRDPSMTVTPQIIESTLGAPISFELLYQGWFTAVSRWVLALGARPSDHEDLVQDVFIVAYRRLSHFDGTSIAGWLFQIARRKVRDYRQLSWVQYVRTSETQALFNYAEESTLGPFDRLETKQKSELLSRRLDKLPSTQRSVFMLFELEGLSGHEIAQQQQVPLNTVWVRLYTARRKLLARPAPPQRKRSAPPRPHPPHP